MVFILLFSDKTECIGVPEILAELEFVRTLLTTKTVIHTTHTEELSAETVEVVGTDDVKEEVNVSVVHVPQWDIVDSDFDSFPNFPTLDLAEEQIDSKDFVDELYKFKDQYPELFYSSTGLLGLVVVGIVVLFAWIYCKKTEERVLVIEHPHFQEENELIDTDVTPLRNITPMSAAIAAGEEIGSSMSSISLSGFLEQPRDIPQPTLRHSKTCKNFTTEL